jgi:L-amino acid N-acyltransferase YncA
MITIREATLEDLPAMLAIYNHAILTTTATFDLEEWTLEQRREWFSHYGGRDPLLVAVREGEVIGYSSLSKFRDKQAYRNTCETSVYIAEHARNQGVGKLLLAENIRRAKELGYHTIIAGITAGNEASVRLHERFGFTQVGHFRQVGFKFNAWQDVVFYQLMLE